VYDDPAYAEVRERLHRELDQIRLKYGDSDSLSRHYIDVFLDDVERDGIYGVNQAKLREILAKRKKE
jgi:hypothetical protein